MEISTLQKLRSKYQPQMPEALKTACELKEGSGTNSVADKEQIQQLFPNTYGLPTVQLLPSKTSQRAAAFNVGVILSGGQAPGGHNVISGIFDALKQLNINNKLYGFLGGPSGLIEHQYIELTDTIIDHYRNTGGFDIIGSGRTKLEEEWQFEKGREICEKLDIKAIIIIGGDDSNTNACILAEYYMQKGYGIQVIGCPKTIDGDLKNDYIEASFGFDTACKVYSELIGNIQKDANSAKKYWHFIRLMGRSASHITLECALQTHPNICLISEEIEKQNASLNDIVEYIADIVMKRAAKGLFFGTVLVPEGLIEFIPSVRVLIQELNDLLAKKPDFHSFSDEDKQTYIYTSLTPANRELLRSFPESIAKQLMLDRDPHGNVMVSQIETEKLLIGMVAERLEKAKKEGLYKGHFSTLSHFFGYEGRCAYPSNFDANYCYSIGHTAVHLIRGGKTGYMALIKNLTKPVNEWIAGGIPITMIMHLERRKGEMKPVIQKAVVDLNDQPFKYFAANREKWAMCDDTYLFPGPIQYFGPSEICDKCTETLLLERSQSKVNHLL